MRKTKEKIRDAKILVAIETELKEKFAFEAGKEFMTMSSKINQLISEYLKTKI